jgi:uncharacterized membrane protein YkvA (DUF1232 family)
MTWAVLANLRQWASELKAQLLTLWFARSHPDTPRLAKITAAFVVAYAFSPIDLIPDFIPVLGYLDDLIIVPLGIYLTLRMLPARVVAASRQKADEWIAAHRGKPKSYAAGALILVLWLACGYWAWTALGPRFRS